MTLLPKTARTSLAACAASRARRLLLLDPYLAVRSGHHHEFAEDVISAASALGLQGIVFTHRRFRALSIQGAPACGVFRERLWQRTLGGLALHVLGRAGFSRATQHWRGRLSDRLEQRREIQFGRNVADALFRVGPAGDDLVFLPNMTHVETFGLARLFRDEPDLTRRVSWHIEFHYPPDQGRDGAHRARSDDECLIRRALQTLELSRSGQSVYCYTDTDELTNQYGSLGVCEFQTLPIPVSSRFVAPSSGNAAQNSGDRQQLEPRPLTVVYLGDSRTEKGFELLPDVLRDVWPDLVETGRLRFVIQSFINRRWKQRSLVRTQQLLRQFPAPAVQLIERPLEGDEYRGTIAAGDIMLLPYAREAYRARSSGILAEALAAGIPAIVPAETWLSGQLTNVWTQFVTESKQVNGAISRPGGQPPIPGLVYHGGVTQIAAAIRQLVAEYDHFRAHTAALASNWSAYHNPQSLLEMLLKREAEPSRGTTAGHVIPRSERPAA